MTTHAQRIEEICQSFEDAGESARLRGEVKALRAALAERDTLAAAQMQRLEDLTAKFSALTTHYQDTICELMSVQAERDALWDEKYLAPRKLEQVAVGA